MKFESRPPTLDEYKALRSAVGWWPTEDGPTQAALNRALFSVVVLQDDKVIGIGRVGGDGGLYYYLQDVMVEPAHQGQGIGKQIVRRLLGWINQTAPKGAFIGLMAAKGLRAFYEEFGFAARAADAPGMFQVKG